MSGFRTIGVLGGMGPAATADFFGKLLAASGAGRDQDHPRVLIDCDPTLPERHAAIRGEGPSPGPRLAAMARGLATAGAEVLCMPCNTAHAFEDEIRAAVDLPFVSIIDASVDATLARAPEAGAVGLLAAQGTLDADLYGPAFARRGLEALRPEPDAQQAFMTLLWRIKAGDRGEPARAEMRRLADALIARGARAVVAACTEAPLVLDDGDVAAPVIDSSAALAAATISAARR